MNGRILELPVDEIEATASTQVRRSIDNTVVDEYRQAILAGALFPPVTVFAEDGSQRSILADGFHRLEAAKEAGHGFIAAEVREGGVHEALAYALGANGDHGLRRSNVDKRRAVEIAARDPEWCTWSNVDIGRLCRVSESLVRKVREDLVVAGEIDRPEVTKVRRSDQVIERKTSNTTRVCSHKTNMQPRCGPRSQDQIDAAEFFELVDSVRACAYDGRDAARRYEAQNRRAEIEFLHQWIGEFLDSLEEQAGAVGNGQATDELHADIPF